MRSRAGEVQSFTCPLPMRRTAFPFCWPWGHGTTNGRRDNLWEQRRCSDKQKGSSGSATTIIVQRQCRNTARADGTNHDHSSADRALCNCDVGFHWQPDQSARFSDCIKDFGLLRGLRPPTKATSPFCNRRWREGILRSALACRLVAQADCLPQRQQEVVFAGNPRTVIRFERGS